MKGAFLVATVAVIILLIIVVPGIKLIEYGHFWYGVSWSTFFVIFFSVLIGDK